MEVMEVMEELDLNSNCLPPELEVKKLQQLVRRLELQNEQLRASGCTGGLAPGFGLGGPGAIRLLAPRCLSPPVEPFEYFQPHGAGDGASEPGEDEAEPSVLDGLELLDLEVLCCHEEEEETWLYESPKAVELGDDSLTPLQWSRHVLDRPKTEVEAARRSLSLRLEQVSRWRSSLSSPSHASPGPPLSRVAGVSPIRAPPCSTPRSSDRHAPSLSSSLHHVLHRTFSPVGREFPPPLADRTPTFLPHLENSILRRSVLSPQSSMDSDLVTSEDESLTLHGYKLHDLTDVQVMARLQEESLRQDYASTSSTLANRRSQSFTFQLSQLSAGRDLEEEDDDEEEEDDEDYGLLPPPQARLTRLPHSHTFSSMRDWRRSTTSLCTPPSTPPLPSAGFALQPLARSQLPGLGAGSFCTAEPPGFRSGSGEFENKLRRSMPNLVRAPSMPSVPSASPCLLRNSLSFDSSSGLARLQSSIPSPGQLHHRVQSVGNFLSLSRQPLKATAYVSPTIKGSAPPSLLPPSGGSGGGNSWSNSGIPLFSKSAAGGATPTSTSRSSLPRPASCVGATSSTPRSKVALPARSLLTPPKSLSTLSALRDGAWRDGCY